MFCPNCGKQIPDGSKFCMSCGKSTTAAASGHTVKEVCTIEFTGEKPGCLFEIITIIPFVEPSITCWYEAQVADKTIAKSPTFPGQYTGGGIGIPPYQGGNETARKALIDGLQAEGWEPVIDPRWGTINSMQRTVSRS